LADGPRDFLSAEERDGAVVEAYWLTDFSIQAVTSQALFAMAKSRWEIENQGFNEAKTFHAWSISATIIRTACWWSGCSLHWP
jgi:hypothetical protein